MMVKDKRRMETTDNEPASADQADLATRDDFGGSTEQTTEDSIKNETFDSATTAQASENGILKQKLQETEDRLLRLAAEFDNFKKRTARQFETMTLAANERLLGSLLEVMDSFDRALEHVTGNVNREALAEGIRLTHSQLLGLLERYNVSVIEAVGKPFDPALHDALMQVASVECPEGHVAFEIARGYKLGDRVLRHSRVAVSTGKANAAGEGADEQPS